MLFNFQTNGIKVYKSKTFFTKKFRKKDEAKEFLIISDYFELSLTIVNNFIIINCII